jgi:hypothetical protein
MRQQGPEYQKSTIQMGPVLMNCNGQRSKQHQGGLNVTHQADIKQISAKTNWTKLMLVGKASSILQNSIVFMFMGPCIMNQCQ